MGVGGQRKRRETACGSGPNVRNALVLSTAPHFDMVRSTDQAPHLATVGPDPIFPTSTEI